MWCSEYFCLYCGKKIENPYAPKTNKYCSNECRRKYKREQYIERWKNGEENGLKGKYQITNEENLQVLCPNCHAMTDNYGSRNKNATKGRSKYFGKSKN